MKLLVFRIEDLENAAFGNHQLWAGIGIITLNYASRFYERNISTFFTHEVLHHVLSELEDHETSVAFDNIFPTLFFTECLIDGEFKRHILWRLKKLVA